MISQSFYQMSERLMWLDSKHLRFSCTDLSRITDWTRMWLCAKKKGLLWLDFPMFLSTKEHLLLRWPNALCGAELTVSEEGRWGFSRKIAIVNRLHSIATSEKALIHRFSMKDCKSDCMHWEFTAPLLLSLSGKETRENIQITLFWEEQLSLPPLKNAFLPIGCSNWANKVD